MILILDAFDIVKMSNASILFYIKTFLMKIIHFVTNYYIKFVIVL